MRVLLLGINHRTAPVELRESLAIGPGELPGVLSAFKAAFPDRAEAVLLSTCNRTELYVARPSKSSPTVEELRRFVSEATGSSLEAVTASSLHREQQPAVHHLFRVTAGLDAMAVGESQVLGQVRRAYEASQEAGLAGPTLHRLFQRALSSAREAHKASGVDSLRQSVSSMAVEFAGNLFESFHDKTVAGVGAGEITKSTLVRMREKRPGRTWIVNRTAEAGQRLAAQLGLSLAEGSEHVGGARVWDELDEVLVEADVVLTGTGATQPIITEKRFRPLLRRRKNRPLFLIDLAVPRDIEPAVGLLPNVYLYNIDDLNAALAEIPHRREKIERCEQLIRQAADQSLGESQHQELGVLVRQLRGKLQRIGEDETRRTQRKIQALHSRGEYERIDALLEEHTHRLINKVLHLPLRQLHDKGAQPPLGFYAAALRQLFDLEDGPAGRADASADAVADAGSVSEAGDGVNDHE